MPYTTEWTPSNVNIDSDSIVKVTSWDNKEVPGTEFFISGNAVVITVDIPNKYKVTVRNGPNQETIRLYIPNSGTYSLEARLQQYIDDALSQYTPPPGGGTPSNIYPDPTPGHEGYFIFQAPEETI